MCTFPQLETDLNIIRRNTLEIKRRCEACGIKLTPTVKGVNADEEIVRAVLDAGIDWSSSSAIGPTG